MCATSVLLDTADCMLVGRSVRSVGAAAVRWRSVQERERERISN